MGIFGGEEVVTIDDLVEREGIYYKKFTDVPFSGKVTGIEQGTFKNGKKEGPWVSYWENGQLKMKGDYGDRGREGPWVSYWENGQLEMKGDYRDRGREGPWVSYWENGQLEMKGDYKNGKTEGPWVGYNEDGTVNEKNTVTYKNGFKVD